MPSTVYCSNLKVRTETGWTCAVLVPSSCSFETVATMKYITSNEIQPNWEEELRKPSGAKIWVSCLQQGEGKDTIHDWLRVSPRDVSSSASLKGGGKDFVVTQSNQCTLAVQCLPANCSTTFVCPHKTLRLHRGKLLDVDVSPSGALGVCSGEAGLLYVWDADTGEKRRVLEGHVMDVVTCRFFPSGAVVLSGGMDMSLRVWSVQDGSCPRKLTGHTRTITDTAMVDRGRNILSVSLDGKALLWDCGSGKCVDTVASIPCPINGCALHTSASLCAENSTPPQEPECGTQDKVLLLSCEDGTLRTYDLRARKEVLKFSRDVTAGGQDTHGRPSAGNKCVFTSDTRAVCGYQDGALCDVDLRMGGEAVQTVSFGSSPLTSIACAGREQCIVGHADGTCVVWNTSCSSDIPVIQCKLTGPDCDSVTAVRMCAASCQDKLKVFTSCRDGCVREYSLAPRT